MRQLYLIPFLLVFACLSSPEIETNNTTVTLNITENNTKIEPPKTYIAVIGDNELFNTVEYSLPEGYEAVAVGCTDENISEYSYFIIDEPSSDCIELISFSNPSNLYLNTGSYSSSNVFGFTPDEGQYAKALAELIGNKKIVILFEESQSEFKELFKNHYEGEILLEENFSLVADNQLLRIKQLYPEALLILSGDGNIAADVLEKSINLKTAKNIYGGKYEINYVISHLMPLWNGFKGVYYKKEVTSQGEEYLASYINKYKTPNNREKVLIGADASAMMVDAIESKVPPLTYMGTIAKWDGYTGEIRFNYVHQRIGTYLPVEISNGELVELYHNQ